MLRTVNGSNLSNNVKWVLIDVYKSIDTNRDLFTIIVYLYSH